jgi:hypothetical protein
MANTETVRNRAIIRAFRLVLKLIFLRLIAFKDLASDKKLALRLNIFHEKGLLRSVKGFRGNACAGSDKVFANELTQLLREPGLPQS